jgi:hypothetical protein
MLTPMSDAGGSKNDPKPGKKREQRTPSVSKESLPVFSLLFAFGKMI